MPTVEKSGLMTLKDAAGNKTLLYPVTKAENVDGLEEMIAGNGFGGKTSNALIGVTTAGSNTAYTATVDGITSLEVGTTFIMIPHVDAASSATLNVNGLGAKTLRRCISGNNITTLSLGAHCLYAGKPTTVVYDGTYWVIDNPKPLVADLYGVLSQPNLQTITLSKSGWSTSTKQQTVSCSGVSASETQQMITPIPAIASQDAYYNAGIRCVNQAANSLTFQYDSVPTVDITVNVVTQLIT